ncbi:hypothetical protein RJJ65_36115, partial [Rhizobium hidalgonense]
SSRESGSGWSNSRRDICCYSFINGNAEKTGFKTRQLMSRGLKAVLFIVSNPMHKKALLVEGLFQYRTFY